MGGIMNTGRLSGATLEKGLIGKLEDLLRSVGWIAPWQVERFPTMKRRGFDLRVKLRIPAGKVELWVQFNSEPRPSQFPTVRVAGERKQLPVPVLGAPFISSRMAAVCEENGWSWFDLAGNCRLDIPGVLHLHHTGNAPILRRPRPTANLSTPETGRVIRALLAPDNAGTRWTQRYLAEHFGEITKPVARPSLGLVNKVVRHLRDEAFIEQSADGGFRLRDPLKLLFAWRDAYRFDRHERRGYFTLLQGTKLRAALHRLDLQEGGFTAYAAFSAAEFQAPHVRQPKTWLYVAANAVSRFEQFVEAKPVESGENIVVLIPDDEGVFYMGDAGSTDDNRMACTNEVQTYVDLCHCGGRGAEAAEALLNQRLKPEWKQHGLSV